MPKHDLTAKEYSLITKLSPIPHVDAVVFNEESVLLGLRNISPLKGSWATIGGRVQKGETLEDAVHRHLSYNNIYGDIVSRLGSFEYITNIRHDVTLGYLVQYSDGSTPIVDKEFKKFKWFQVNKYPKTAPFYANLLQDAYVKIIELENGE